MAKSNAKKYREKITREGSRNPGLNRSPFSSLNMSTRKSKTKKDYMYQNKHKNQSLSDGYDGSFYFVNHKLLSQYNNLRLKTFTN